jgi:hypothetical protein
LETQDSKLSIFQEAALLLRMKRRKNPGKNRMDNGEIQENRTAKGAIQEI